MHDCVEKASNTTAIQDRVTANSNLCLNRFECDLKAILGSGSIESWSLTTSCAWLKAGGKIPRVSLVHSLNFPRLFLCIVTSIFPAGLRHCIQVYIYVAIMHAQCVTTSVMLSWLAAVLVSLYPAFMFWILGLIKISICKNVWAVMRTIRNVSSCLTYHPAARL